MPTDRGQTDRQIEWAPTYSGCPSLPKEGILTHTPAGPDHEGPFQVLRETGQESQGGKQRVVLLIQGPRVAEEETGSRGGTGLGAVSGGA